MSNDLLSQFFFNCEGFEFVCQSFDSGSFASALGIQIFASFLQLIVLEMHQANRAVSLCSQVVVLFPSPLHPVVGPLLSLAWLAQRAVVGPFLSHSVGGASFSFATFTRYEHLSISNGDDVIVTQS